MRGDELPELARLVEDDPAQLDERIEQVQRGLRSDDPHERMDAGRAFRVAAKADPATVAPHRATLLDLLSDSNGSLQLSGAVGIAELADHAPSSVIDTVPELLVVLERTVAPAIQMAAIRALTRIGRDTPEAIADSDPVLADLLRTATPPIKTAVVTVFAGAVVETPSNFPETIRAMEAALDDEYAEVRRYAAALAAIASVDPSVLSSVDAVLDRVEELEAHVTGQPWHHDETVERAARTLRTVDDADGT